MRSAVIVVRDDTLGLVLLTYSSWSLFSLLKSKNATFVYQASHIALALHAKDKPLFIGLTLILQLRIMTASMNKKKKKTSPNAKAREKKVRKLRNFLIRLTKRIVKRFLFLSFFGFISFIDWNLQMNRPERSDWKRKYNKNYLICSHLAMWNWIFHQQQKNTHTTMKLCRIANIIANKWKHIGMENYEFKLCIRKY